MSQIAQLSEAEIGERYHVTGKRPVAFMLSGFVKANDQFSVLFGGGDDMMLTRLLAAKPEKGMLVFDCSGSDEINRRLLKSTRLVFTGRPGGIHVQFTTGQASEMLFAGGKAFRVDLPAFIVRMQRRETFRIETPRGRPLQFFGRRAGGSLLNFTVHDISVAGLGVTASASPEDLAVGERLENCHFALPEDERELFFSATVRHVTSLVARTGLQQWRIGLQFDDMPALEQNRIQRYIAKIERERHELLDSRS